MLFSIRYYFTIRRFCLWMSLLITWGVSIRGRSSLAWQWSCLTCAAINIHIWLSVNSHPQTSLEQVCIYRYMQGHWLGPELSGKYWETSVSPFSSYIPCGDLGTNFSLPNVCHKKRVVSCILPRELRKIIECTHDTDTLTGNNCVGAVSFNGWTKRITIICNYPLFSYYNYCFVTGDIINGTDNESVICFVWTW